MNAASFPDMHDWSLLTADYDWPSARLAMRFRTADGATTLVASEVADLHITQRRTWGPSVSVNRADWVAGADERPAKLRIEMQSGDIITVEAAAFKVE